MLSKSLYKIRTQFQWFKRSDFCLHNDDWGNNKVWLHIFINNCIIKIHTDSLWTKWNASGMSDIYFLKLFINCHSL